MSLIGIDARSYREHQKPAQALHGFLLRSGPVTYHRVHCDLRALRVIGHVATDSKVTKKETFVSVSGSVIRKFLCGFLLSSSQ